MRVLIVGLGSIGQRHLRNIKQIRPDAHITIWHQHRKTNYSGPENSIIDNEVFCLHDAIQSKPDIALISNPASLHIETATSLAKHNIHGFIEKPLSDSLNGIAELIKISDDRNLVLMVGYVFRFYRPLQMVKQTISEGIIGRPISIRAEVGQYLPDWRPNQDYKQSVSSCNSLGGGAVLELSHELDSVLWMMGDVHCTMAITGHLSDLEIDTEDTAEIILQFNNDAIGSIHLDMVQRAPSRNCKIVGTEGTIIWDGSNHKVSMYTSKEKVWTDIQPASDIDRNEMYIGELKHFLECVESGDKPQVGIEDGLKTLELVLAIKKSAAEKISVTL